MFQARSPWVLPQKLLRGRQRSLPSKKVVTVKQDKVEKLEAKQTKSEQSPKIPRSSPVKRSGNIACGKVVKQAKVSPGDIAKAATSLPLQVLQATAMRRTILENIEKDPSYDWVRKQHVTDYCEKLNVLLGNHGTFVRKFLVNDWEAFKGSGHGFFLLKAHKACHKCRH